LREVTGLCGIISSVTVFPPQRTLSEYFAFEYGARDRHEFFNGRIVAMPGGSEIRSLITANVLVEIGIRLKGSCYRVYDCNLRVSVPSTGLYTYPDATVVCKPIQFDPKDPYKHTVLNPTVLVEVLSAGTEANHREFKLVSYRQIESLQHYLLVTQTSALVEMCTRAPDGSWGAKEKVGGIDAVVSLAALKIDVPLADIYASVEFP
jgi:Uma2 family endonuclease